MKNVIRINMNFSFVNVARFTMCALCVSAAVLVSCNNPDDPSNPSATLETISITAPTVTAENRTVVDKAGEFSYADKADATVRMTFKNAEPATKDSAIVINLASKVTWAATPAKLALTGDLVLAPTLSGAEKITLKYGSLEIKDFFTVANTDFKVTRSGKSADMPFFGFNNVEAVGNATNEVSFVTEAGKNYQVNTLTQKFRFTHSDETTKEVEFVVMEARLDITGVTPQLVSVEEISRKVGEDFNSITYVIRHNYNFGNPVDKEIVINYGVTFFGLKIDNLYFLKKDWTIVNYVPASSEIIRELTNNFDGYSIMYVVKRYMYKFSFKEDISGDISEQTVEYAEMNYVTGGLPPLKLSFELTATADFVLGGSIGEVTIDDGTVFDEYKATCNFYVKCDDAVSTFPLTNRRVLVKKE